MKPDTEFKVLPVNQSNKSHVMTNDLVKLTMAGQMARDFIQGIIMAQMANVVQGNEARQLSNNDVVVKAFDLAEIFFAEARKRSMLLDMPNLEELLKDTSSAVGFKT